jgi:hypothetical protein
VCEYLAVDLASVRSGQLTGSIDSCRYLSGRLSSSRGIRQLLMRGFESPRDVGVGWALICVNFAWKEPDGVGGVSLPVKLEGQVLSLTDSGQVVFIGIHRRHADGW